MIDLLLVALVAVLALAVVSLYRTQTQLGREIARLKQDQNAVASRTPDVEVALTAFGEALVARDSREAFAQMGVNLGGPAAGADPDAPTVPATGLGPLDP